MILNLGCGFNKLDNAVNIDYDSYCNPDLILDLEKQKLPFEDNSVDKVIAYHILDRIGSGFFDLMKELYRVAKNGSIIDICSTYPTHDNFIADPSICRAITIQGMWSLSKKYNDTCSKSGARYSNLAYIHNIDFEISDMRYNIDPRYKNILDLEKNFEKEFIFWNNVRMETLIKLVTVKV